MIRLTLKERDLKAWGRRIGAELEPPAFIGLRGPLGAGKSVLARAIARGAGVEGHLPSPTFNIVFRYDLAGGGAVVHADLYRLGSAAELAGIGWDDIVTDDAAIVLVEWPERAGAELPVDRWEVSLDYDHGKPGVRRVDVNRQGAPPSLPTFPMNVQ